MQKTVFQNIKNFLTKLGLDMTTADVRYAFILYYVVMETFDDYMSIPKIAKHAIEENKLNTSVEAFMRSYHRAKLKLKKLGVESDVNKLSIQLWAA